MPTPPLPARFPLTAAFAAASLAAAGGGDGFAPGTRFDTPSGPVAAARLRPGDLLCTADGGTIALHRLDPAPAPGDAPAAGAPPGPAVLIRRGALDAAGLPRRDLLLGVQQAVSLEGHRLAAAALLAAPAVRRAGQARLVRLVAASPAVVLAEGLPCALGAPTRPEADVHAGAALARARLRLAPPSRGQVTPPAVTGSAGPALQSGSVTLTGDGILVGWALDRAAPDAPVLLEILLDDLTIGFALADQFRADLAVAGLGDGRCGFSFRMPPRQPGREHLLRLHMVGSGAALLGTPLLLAAPLPAAAVLGEADDGAGDAQGGGVQALASALDALAQGSGRAGP